MGSAAFAAVVLLYCGIVAGDTSLSGQWMSQDSVYNHQNIFQIQNGTLLHVCIRASREC